MKKNEPTLALTPAPLPQTALDDRQRLACLRLIRSDNIGPVSFRELINHCGGAEEALARLPEMAKRGGRAIRVCTRDAAESELERAAKAGATPVFTIEPGYPALLAQVDNPPPMLYVKGRHELLNRPAIAIVGSRGASAAGQTLTRQFAGKLGAAGLVVVSGLARGIDGVAHEAALGTGTIAVVAGGVDAVYPPEHARLQQRIGEEGCLASEQPPGFNPRAQDFPRRNRIISGIALGVVVVEAAKRSGTLITARMAGEQGREVFAVPGHPLDPRAEGTNYLLKEGATLVTVPGDVIAALSPLLSPVMRFSEGAVQVLSQPVTETVAVATLPPINIDDSDRARVLEALGPAPVSLDDIARATGLPIRIVQTTILELGLAGRIERHGQQLVSRINPAKA